LDKTPKGYDATDFNDAWKRYLPPSSDSRHKGNNRHIFDNQNNFVADVADVADIHDKEYDDVMSLSVDSDPFVGLRDDRWKLLTGT
jgi:hypothetical protein